MKPLVETYRPVSIKDCVLPLAVSESAITFLKTGEFPNLLLTGSPGVGKTSLARALCHDLDFEIAFINAAKDGNIQTVRTKISMFASIVSFEGKRKAIILDEADGITPAAQDSLKGVIEEFPDVRFILTANLRHKIIEAIHSRVATLDFTITKEDRQRMLELYFERAIEILKAENIPYNVPSLATMLKKFFPDFRRFLNNVQANGRIDTGALSVANINFSELILALKKKDFGAVKTWIVDNALDSDPSVVFRNLYDAMHDVVDPGSIPNLILLLGEHSYRNAFVMDKEIVLAAFCQELMNNVVFK